MINLILNTDSYKASHFLQYPPNAQYLSSYIESRGGVYPATLFFGLQMFLKEYLSTPITLADIDEAEQVLSLHGLPFHRQGWLTILERYQGYLPLEIEAVPEGSIIPTGNVLVQIVNTDPEFAWLTNYVETALLRAVWYPTTVATFSKYCQQIIADYLQETADDLSNLPLKLHDFGARGASSEETVAIGGLAHLVNFTGTDSLSAVVAGKRYYHIDMAGFAIPAAEHSTITSWGRDGEEAAFRNLLTQFAQPGKVVAAVSDSYNLWHVIDTIWGEHLKQQIISSGATLVVRPDSGDPVIVVPEAIERMMKKFGYLTNRKGYKMLPPYLRLIQGDGVNASSIKAILEAMKQRGLSADNVAFGIGSELLQKLNRDTQKFAMKASAIYLDGQWQAVYKDPITDHGKRSKKGRLALIKNQQGWQTVARESVSAEQNQLVTVFRNGQLLNDEHFADIRQRAQHMQI